MRDADCIRIYIYKIEMYILFTKFIYAYDVTEHDEKVVGEEEGSRRCLVTEISLAAKLPCSCHIVDHNGTRFTAVDTRPRYFTVEQDARHLHRLLH